MAWSSVEPLPGRPTRAAFPFRFVLPAVILLALVGGLLVFYVATGSSSPKAGAPADAAIEERWGIRVTQIGVTADGGLVDFRYTVTDPDKALAMGSEVENLPVLIAEDGGAVVNSAALMPQKHDLVPGRTYYFLYRNTEGGIKSGSLVTVAFGDLRLEHFSVK